MARASQFEQNRHTVLRSLHDRWMKHSKPPAVRELATQANVSVSTMHSYLGRLAEEGLVEWRPKSHRSLALTPQGIEYVQSLDA